MQFANYKFFFDPIEQFALASFETTTLSYLQLTGANFYYFGSLIFFLWILEVGLIQEQSVIRLMILKLFLFVSEIVVATITLKFQRYYLFLIFLFCLILLSNISGLLPFSYTVTSSLVYAFTLSIISVGGLTLIGFERYGFHFFDRFLPAGVPYLIVPLLAFIEIISYLMRFFSLAIRLFANMVSGHILIKILISASWFLLINFSFANGVIASIISLLCLIILVLELFIAFLQAYVFTFLTAVYLSEIIATNENKK